ncbi:MAG: redoxin domain-containing protein [Thermoplasmata archaeon]|nr:redoxin domain-containing protein [Thermoplasmata archaeon]
MAAEVEDKAPDFELLDVERNKRTLGEFSGSKLVIAFYPGAFTSVCTQEMCALRDSLARFNEMNATVVGISVNDPFSNKAFSDQNQLNFPLLSDYARRAVTDYDVALNDFAGMSGYTAAKRSVFVVDGEGTIRYKWVSEDPGVEPNYDDIAEKLREIA